MNIKTLKQCAEAFDYLFDAVVVTDLKAILPTGIRVQQPYMAIPKMKP